MRKLVLLQFALFSVFTAIIGMAAFGILLLDFQLPGLFKVWPRPRGGLEIDMALIAAFGLQHSLMARQGFKRVLRVLMPPELERSFYVLMSGFMLLVMAGLWIPSVPPLYDLRGTPWQWPLHLLALSGLVLTGWAGMVMGGLDLLGVKALLDIARGTKPGEDLPFRTPGPYRWVRHPIYLGILIVCWATPAMTHDHLLFAELMTAYILIGAAFEERDLLRRHGTDYARYQRQVPMLLPWPRRWRGWGG